MRMRKSTVQRLTRNAVQIAAAAYESISDVVSGSDAESSSKHAVRRFGRQRRVSTSNRSLVNVGVSVVAFGLVGTFALPAYALTPGTIDAEYGQALAAQSIYAHQTKIDASRPTTMAIGDAPAAEIVRPSYDGPTYRDYLENPPYPNFSLAQVFQVAKQYIGTPYLAYGASPAGFDCSGFTMFVYSQFGIPLVHLASAQMNAGTIISEDDAQPGDLVWMPGHVGFWAGPGMMLDSPTEGKSIDIRPIWSSYYVVFRVVI